MYGNLFDFMCYCLELNKSTPDKIQIKAYNPNLRQFIYSQNSLPNTFLIDPKYYKTLHNKCNVQ